MAAKTIAGVDMERNYVTLTLCIQGAPIKNNPSEKKLYVSAIVANFSTYLDILQRRIQAVYAAKLVTIFQLIKKLQLLNLCALQLMHFGLLVARF